MSIMLSFDRAENDNMLLLFISCDSKLNIFGLGTKTTYLRTSL